MVNRCIEVVRIRKGFVYKSISLYSHEKFQIIWKIGAISECKKWQRGVNFLTAWSQNVAHPVIVTFPQIPTVIDDLSVEPGASDAGLTGETSLHVVNSWEATRFVVVEWPENKGSEDWGLLLTQCTVSAEGTIQFSDWWLSGANGGWDGNGTLRLSNWWWGVAVLKFTLAFWFAFLCAYLFFDQWIAAACAQTWSCSSCATSSAGSPGSPGTPHWLLGNNCTVLFKVSNSRVLVVLPLVQSSRCYILARQQGMGLSEFVVRL